MYRLLFKSSDTHFKSSLGSKSKLNKTSYICYTNSKKKKYPKVAQIAPQRISIFKIV